MTMWKRQISLALVFSLLLGVFGAMPISAETENTIKIGDYIQMGEYYDEPILWRCVDIDENGPLMLSDKILCIKAFDVPGDNTQGSHGRSGPENNGLSRTYGGSNYWADSNIRDWLNSTASAGNVTWSCGNPPISSQWKDVSYALWKNNSYDKEPGFLSDFTEKEMSMIRTVSQKQLLVNGEYGNWNPNFFYDESEITEILNHYDARQSETTSDTVFLLSIEQLYRVFQNRNILGEMYYIGEPTQSCVYNTEYGNHYPTVGEKWESWLRTPAVSQTEWVRYVSCEGEVYEWNACDKAGIRPAFYLNTSLFVAEGGSGTQNDPYVVDKTMRSRSISGGDIDGDGQLAINDLVRLIAYQASVYFLSEQEWENADINGDGKVLTGDLVMFLSYFAAGRGKPWASQ